jgi:hypothetical protein
MGAAFGAAVALVFWLIAIAPTKHDLRANASRSGAASG